MLVKDIKIYKDILTMNKVIQNFFLTSFSVGVGYMTTHSLVQGIQETKTYVDTQFPEKKSPLLYMMFGVPICIPYLYCGSILGGVYGITYPVIYSGEYIYKRYKEMNQ